VLGDSYDGPIKGSPVDTSRFKIINLESNSHSSFQKRVIYPLVGLSDYLANGEQLFSWWCSEAGKVSVGTAESNGSLAGLQLMG